MPRLYHKKGTYNAAANEARWQALERLSGIRIGPLRRALKMGDEMWAARKRLTGQKNASGTLKGHWLLPCAQESCGRLVRFVAADLGQRKCRRCAHLKNLNLLTTVLCAVPACKRALTDQEKATRRIRCASCRARRWNGHAVQRDDVWARREQIVKIEKNRVWLRCAKAGCDKIWAWSSQRANQDLCGAHARRDKTTPFWGPWSNLLRQAKLRNIAVTLTYDDFVDICMRNDPCIYCGENVKRVKTRVGKSSNGYGLDRADSRGQYSVSNVVPCCWPCNRRKSHGLTPREACVVAALRAGNTKMAKDLVLGARPLNWPKNVKFK